MTRDEMEAAIQVAQVTYLLEGGEKGDMMTHIPAEWGEIFLERDYLRNKSITKPWCEARRFSTNYSKMANAMKAAYLPVIKDMLAQSTILLKQMEKK